MPTQPTPEGLCAIKACLETARRYMHGIDRLDGDCMKSSYWPDVTDDHGSFVGNAPGFVEHCSESHTLWEWPTCAP